MGSEWSFSFLWNRMVSTLFHRNEIAPFLCSKHSHRNFFRRNGFLHISFEIPTIQTGPNFLSFKF
jgi:hypothetical protein